MRLLQGISTEVKIAFTTGCVVAVVVSIFWICSQATIHGKLVGQRQEQLARLFSDQVRHLNQLGRERAQLAGSAARAGEGVMRLRHKGELKWSDAQWDQFLLEDLKSELQRYPEVIRLGIWYEPHTFSRTQKLRGYSATLTPEGVKVAVEAGSSAPDKSTATPPTVKSVKRSVEAEVVTSGTSNFEYHEEKWYSGLVHSSVPNHSAEAKDEVWYGPYTDGPALLMTVSKLMFDDAGTVLGVATADWDLHHLVADIEKFTPTGTSQAFLIDPRTSTFITVGSRQDLAHKDVSTVAWGSFALHLQDSEMGSQFALAAGNRWVHKFTLENGLLFGLVVPEGEALAPVREVEKAVFTVGVLAFVVIVIIMVPVAGVFLRPIRQSIALLKELGTGGWRREDRSVLHADMELLIQSVQDVADYVRSIERDMMAVAAGRTEVSVAPSDSSTTETSKLSPGAIELMSICRVFTEDVRIKLARLSEGDERDPIWQREYHGFWKKLLEELRVFGLKQSTALREVTAVFDAVTAGESRARMNGVYSGDLAELQRSVNAALECLTRSSAHGGRIS